GAAGLLLDLRFARRRLARARLPGGALARGRGAERSAIGAVIGDRPSEVLEPIRDFDLRHLTLGQHLLHPLRGANGHDGVAGLGWAILPAEAGDAIVRPTVGTGGGAGDVRR